MGLLKLPDVGQIVLPFAILFAALYTFWSLVRKQELVIVRSAGLSVWQFLAPIVGVAMLAGVVHMTVLNPPQCHAYNALPCHGNGISGKQGEHHLCGRAGAVATAKNR
jgi:lipopolysaccharide export LptBFGC system permease protein LptF